jgi:hypothetical protein
MHTKGLQTKFTLHNTVTPPTRFNPSSHVTKCHQVSPSVAGYRQISPIFVFCHHYWSQCHTNVTSGKTDPCHNALSTVSHTFINHGPLSIVHYQLTMSQILVENLVKTFRVAEREPGIGGAIKGLVSRRYRTVRALDGVSFALETGELAGTAIIRVWRRCSIRALMRGPIIRSRAEHR